MELEGKTIEQLIEQLKELGNHKSKRNEYGSERYILSLVKWGLIRRLLSKIFGASPHLFKPAYELAIYAKKGGRIHLKRPCFVSTMLISTWLFRE